MKKLWWAVAAIALLSACGYMIYQWYIPNMIARMIVSDDEASSMVPKNIQKRIGKIKKPVNEGAETVVSTMHTSGITIEQVLKAIDEVEEEQAYNMLDELNNTKIENSDQVFDIAKKHFPVDFNVEVFRKPFTEKVSVKLVKKSIRYANIYKRDEKIDPETAKSIIKKILLQKEEEFNKVVKKEN